ncbi:hypothetical protein [uncultured Corynebacterium sp.]|uniref:hypothetical protein n=1 Tax=uncultured Corynebacterium sp. TaxID=159447 RepID=UPI0025D05647|nr:hypothetical protein [uncultured Corynebacterium sp.]
MADMNNQNQAPAVAAPTLEGAAGTTNSAASASAADGGDAGATDLNGEWTVAADGQSYAGYRVDEVLNGADVTINGQTQHVDATAQVVDEGSLEFLVTLNT